MPEDFEVSTDLMAMERYSYLEDIKWLSDFLVRTTKADSMMALSSEITEILTQVFPFAYVSIFFLTYRSFILKLDNIFVFRYIKITFD